MSLHFLSLAFTYNLLYVAPKTISYSRSCVMLIKCLVNFRVGSAHHLIGLDCLSRDTTVFEGIQIISLIPSKCAVTLYLKLELHLFCPKSLQLVIKVIPGCTPFSILVCVLIPCWLFGVTGWRICAQKF